MSTNSTRNTRNKRRRRTRFHRIQGLFSLGLSVSRSASAQPLPVFTGPSSLVGFRTTKGLFSLGLSVSRSAFAQPRPVFTGPSSLIGFCTTNTRQQESEQHWKQVVCLQYACETMPMSIESRTKSTFENLRRF
ncbi:hypothetical protein HELRODRAFT_160735 [Helobdella robusta]|uniref:Uncharacterized protein n=1 Tax=Helobdella robusta TaxID=6412 RepID=T1EQN3_HELRO|nr:hypothetical protein HELRODRAFT_160735 [Helobdella robusta]ESO06553.1 hypothetical protein HELRODRAFT_160735 [Helobdella robusta]